VRDVALMLNVDVLIQSGQLEDAGHAVAQVILLETEAPGVALTQRGAFDRVSALIRIADR